MDFKTQDGRLTAVICGGEWRQIRFMHHSRTYICSWCNRKINDRIAHA